MSLTYREAYDCLIAAQQSPHPADCFTVKQFADDTGLAERTALKRLMDMVEDGKLETVKTSIDGHLTRVFWFTE